MNYSKFAVLIFVIGSLFLIPSVYPSPFFLQLLITCFIFAMVCESWDLSMGYLGLFNFGHLAFFGIGAYFSGILALYYDVSPWIGLVVSPIVCFFLGLALSLVTLRAGGFAFCLISFAFQMMLEHWIRSGGGSAPGEYGRGGATLTGGTLGLGAIHPIPPFQLGPLEISSTYKIPAYYFTLIFFIFSTYCMYKLMNSRFGLAGVALRDSERYGVSRGINPLTYTAIFMSISTLFAGLGGAVYVHLMQVVGPELIGWSNLVLMCCIVEFGGLGTLLGPAAASFLLTSLTQYLAGLGPYKTIIVGLLMLFTLLAWPTGMAGAAYWVKSRILSKRLSRMSG